MQSPKPATLLFFRRLGSPPRAKQRPVHVLLFIVFEGWQLRVGERREIEQGIARMHEQLEQREREQWYSGLHRSEGRGEGGYRSRLRCGCCCCCCC